jgi:polyhydroxyalkanoate synthesis regulator phasin
MEGRPPESDSPRPEKKGEARAGEEQPRPGEESRPAEVVERVERPAEPQDPEARPATLGEVRTVRRWLAVAGIWAVAASAIAVIALLEARKEEPTGPEPVTGAQLGRVEDDLTERIDELEGQIAALPTSEDVRKLERRLKRVEDAASDTRGDVRRIRGDVDDLTTRVDDVEQAQETAANEDSGTDTETTPENP